jgi:hypothetical protein
MLNPFAGSGYSMAALTLAINKMPPMYTMLGDMGLFSSEGITVRTVIIEQRNNVLNILPTRPVGSPSLANAIGKREIRSFIIPHIPLDDVVLPSEVQGVRAFGSETDTDTMANLMALKLQTMKNKHTITREYLRAGALNGIVYDADGSTVLYDYFNEFGITQHSQDFQLTDLDLEVNPLCLSISRWIESHLYGEMSTGVLALCSPEFFDAFTGHPNVKQAFQYYQNMQQSLGQDYRKVGFQFGGVLWREYYGRASDISGTVHRFIAADEAVAFPLGTTQTFREYFAPADFNETVNTVGLPLYAKQEERDMQRGWDLHTQSNPLPICTRPEVLVRVTMS